MTAGLQLLLFMMDKATLTVLVVGQLTGIMYVETLYPGSLILNPFTGNSAMWWSMNIVVLKKS
jgi:hypothetical protein